MFPYIKINLNAILRRDYQNVSFISTLIGYDEHYSSMLKDFKKNQ